jgi:tRNA (cytidine/uridine-2'-O-)-methyltransferase
MLNIVLFEPEIPPNTGNIIRLCANAGATLHLIHPLGFHLNEKSLRRAGLDYHSLSNIYEHINYDAFIQQTCPRRIFACTTKAKTTHSDVTFEEDDYFIFGPESRGLPDELLVQFTDDKKIKIPMISGSRSINLANSCAIILYEAWRQLNYQ